MKSFTGKLAVVTGGASGMGRSLVRALARDGCSVAFCDVREGEDSEETRRLAEADAAAAGHRVRITSHACDVSKEADWIRFRREVVSQHSADRVELLFNNAGIGGGASLVNSPRGEFERCFDVCYNGVYLGVITFLALLRAAPEARVVNTASAAAFFHMGSPAYAAAKAAVKGLTEALITDFRVNCPNVKASVVMPGHIGTGIFANTVTVQGNRIGRKGRELAKIFEEGAPVTADGAAEIILNGVRADKWRILVGADAEELDRMVRERPEEVYEPAFLEEMGRRGIFTSTPRVPAPKAGEPKM
ncbi:short-chain alcohol dehydrogenase [Hyaloraphidium curvatum]|nr:short-chain alcohol dehydrogenase [Hyaloraphidium curvatum]